VESRVGECEKHSGQIKHLNSRTEALEAGAGDLVRQMNEVTAASEARDAELAEFRKVVEPADVARQSPSFCIQ
jgi:hypothetical protein